MATSQVLLCRRPSPSEAILFVHGWGGDGSSTWGTFPHAVGILKETAQADVFFLDYPSTTSQVAFCAAQLRRFTTHLVRDPLAQVVHPSLPAGAPERPPAFGYTRIIIVAHSMGAVISRRAVLDLDRPPPQGLTDEELARFTMLLFAPAHCGSSIPLLVGSGLGLDFLPGAAAVGAFARLWFQSLRDLEEGSQTLTKLADDSRELREGRVGAGKTFGHLHAVVYHAHNDRVVIQNDFDRDPPFEPVMNRNHRTMCKPNLEYTRPIEALRALLAR